jgi:FkbM family methyltransferase
MSLFLRQLRNLTKLAYNYRGFARLAEAVRKLYSRSPRVLLVNDFDTTLSFYCELDEHMGSQIFWRGSYSGAQLILLDRLLAPHMVFVDIGANHGELTVFAAKRLTEGKVIAFEPVSVLFQKLERNININNFTNVQLVQKGLSDKSFKSTIYTREGRFEDGTKHEGLPTLYPTITRSQIGEVIEITYLDQFVESENVTQIDIIKIDVEGAELAVLQGARGAIARFKPLILMEVNEETSQAAGYPARALLDYLSELDYWFEVILDDGRTHTILPEQLSNFQNIFCWSKS